MTDLLVSPSEAEAEAELDEPKFAHIVDKIKSTEAYVLGTPIEALCGKKWVPSRSPDNLPICKACAEQFRRFLVHEVN